MAARKSTTARRGATKRRAATKRGAASKRGSKKNRYGELASRTVASAMRRRKRGTLQSGSGQKVASAEQAIAIGLSEARKKGGKVPGKSGR